MPKYLTFTKENNSQKELELDMNDDAVILFREDAATVEIYFALKELYNEFTDMIFFELWGDKKT